MRSANRLLAICVGGWSLVSARGQDFAEVMAEDCRVARATGAAAKLVFDLNGHGLSLTQTDHAYRKALARADYIHADGQSLVIASRALYGDRGLPERIATTDFFHDAAAVASRDGLRFFLLGGTQEVVERTRTAMSEMYPSLKIVGARSGYFTDLEETQVCNDIRSSGADVVWVGLGKPKEQVFCVRNAGRLDGVGWVVTSGGLFDFLSGGKSRAPALMQRFGFEWLYRLALEPRRLFWRYLSTNLHATWVLIQAGRRKVEQ